MSIDTKSRGTSGYQAQPSHLLSCNWRQVRILVNHALSGPGATNGGVADLTELPDLVYSCSHGMLTQFLDESAAGVA